MNQIAKVSEVTSTDLAEFLRVGEVTPSEEGFLNTIIGAAKSYMCKYTGLTSEQLDESSDLVIALFVLAQDMYDNRTMYVDSANVNLAVQSILDMHSVNLLPSAVMHDA